MTRRLSLRRAYDVDDLVQLCAADLEIVMHPTPLNPAARAKLSYWLGRAWDSGSAGASGRPPPPRTDE